MSTSTQRKGLPRVGMAFFMLVNTTLALLVLSPYIPNYIIQYSDDVMIQEAEARIPEVRMGTITLTFAYQNGTTVASREVRFNQTRHEFIFGCNLYAFNLTGSPASNEQYTTYFKRLFNLAVLPFYWGWGYEPEPGVYPHDPLLNASMEWCHDNDITIKGHPLVWRRPSADPAWLPDDAGAIVQCIETRVEDRVSRYRDNVTIWDVVNEPVHLPFEGNPSVVENVAKYLTQVRGLDPDGILSVNEYGILGHDFGGSPFYNLIKNLKDTGAPIDLIGIQGREPRTDWIPAWKVKATLDGYAGLGIPIHITEFMATSFPLPITDSWKKGIWNEENQAAYAKFMYTMLFSHPVVEGIIWWDLWDGLSYIAYKESGMLDANMEPKPVYGIMDNLINHEWHTEGSLTTDENGTLTFKGFFGRYELEVDGVGTFTIDASKRDQNVFTIVVD